eukprot:148974_1
MEQDNIVECDDTDELNEQILMYTYLRMTYKYYHSRKWMFYYLLIFAAIPFAICSIQYSFYYIFDDIISWMDKYLSLFCPSYNNIYAGPGSIIVEHKWKSIAVLTLHTIPSGLWMIIGLIQINTYIRSKFIIIHRWSGRLYFLFLALSLCGSLGLLILEPIYNEIYTGSGAFHNYLIFYWFGGIISGGFGLYSIKKKEILHHRQWMMFNYSLCIGAPLLRLCWSIFAWIYP